MRPIDADALKQTIIQDYRREFFGSVLWDILDDMPTIDADAYFDAVDRIKPCKKCRYQIFGSEQVRHGRGVKEEPHD